MEYTHTVYKTYREGPLAGTTSCFVAEVDANGQMLRSNAITCTGYEGATFPADHDTYPNRAAYDLYLREIRFPECDFQIEAGTDGYKNFLFREAS